VIYFEERGVTRKRTNFMVRALGPLMVAAAYAGLAGCSLVGLGGDGIEQKVHKVVWRSRDSYVRLESPDALKGATVPPNAHPVSLDPGRLSNALQKIRIQKPEKKGSVPLFSEWELEQLSTNLSDALAEARPDHDVTFAIVGWHKDFLGLKQPKVTTGRVFYQGGQINMIFGDAQRDAKDQEWITKETEADRRLDPYVPGMRSFTKRHSWKLVAEPGSGIYSAPGIKRSDWIVLAAQAFTVPPAAAAAGGTGAPQGAASGTDVQQLRQEVERLRQDLQRVQGQVPGTYQPPGGPVPGYSPPAAQVPATAAPPPVQGPGPTGSVQQRLIVLEDLRNKGLISEQEYQARRNQILSGF
jgi:hypothetical protein